jgi:hypothetical protein
MPRSRCSRHARVEGIQNFDTHSTLQGVNGRVNSLVSIGTCLYMGGSFTRSAEQPGAALTHAARWCIDLIDDQEPEFEELRGFDSIGPVRAIAYALTPEQGTSDGFVCPLDSNTTHCVSPLK